MENNTPNYLVIAYYHYTHIADAELMAPQHLSYCKSIGIRGRIYIAHEGINGTISGTVDACTTYMDSLKANPLFKGIEFKIDEHHEHAFSRLHVRYKTEIVHSGLRDPKEIDPTKETGKHLRGEEFAKLKDEDDVVIIDVRSNYETRLGRFKNSVTLDIENFREFPTKVSELEQYKDKKIITVCTGGIKCEKASAYLIKKGFKDVYQLHNGIIGYAKETGGKDFDGSLYVFDGRVSVPVNHINPTAIATCKKCNTPTFRNLNCANVECNEQFNMCEKCSDEMEGACSDTCKVHPRKRAYNGTGYYTRPAIEELQGV
ncbi:MAG: rhodanese-related sulfurtransferase [Bacteroidetes bacterium]|nr:MAG: rhodanese-related sulfurtransferase [Bacteroidota bacterium]